MDDGNASARCSLRQLSGRLAIDRVRQFRLAFGLVDRRVGAAIYDGVHAFEQRRQIGQRSKIEQIPPGRGNFHPRRRIAAQRQPQLAGAAR